MSLVQLESFVAVAHTKHVGRAAQKLRVTQPPLTRRIRDLEEELGVSLFVRTSRGVELSPAGEAFLAQAHAILELVGHTRAAMRKWQGRDLGWRQRRHRAGE